MLIRVDGGEYLALHTLDIEIHKYDHLAPCAFCSLTRSSSETVVVTSDCDNNFGQIAHSDCVNQRRCMSVALRIADDFSLIAAIVRSGQQLGGIINDHDR